MEEWFFDLEGVLIDSFETRNLINIDKISLFIKKNDIKEITIFSAAIWNDSDSATFFEEIQEGIEETFGVKVKDVITMEDARKGCNRWKTCFFSDIGEFVFMVGKDIIFKEFTLDKKADGVIFWLVDDEFPHEVLTRKVDGKTLTAGIFPVQSL